MIDLNDFGYFISGAALMLCSMGLWFIAIIPGIDRWSKRFFRILFIVLTLLALCGFIEMILIRYSFPNPALYFILILESLFLSLPMPMMTAYLLHHCGEHIRKSRLFRIVLILWAVYFILLAGIPFISGFYHITPDNQYYRGPLYPLLLLPIAAIEFLNLAAVLRRRKQLTRRSGLSFLIALLPITGATIAQMFVEVYPLIDISVILSALSMYGLILSDQIEQDLHRQREIARRQQEIADQRASIAVLQMRPHFIYNTMTSIYCLCDQDPKLARRVVLDFTNYLRKNFTAIASAAPIPFSSELEHARAYLAVEQAQYEDSLFVDYDTPHTAFRVPPLTLQPIVENAVRHGRDPCAGPFHISIRTRKTDSGSEIIVTDNGRGFQPAKDSEPHIALKNIQQRLETMCKGHLAITAGDGRGTVVTVTIPDSTAAEPHTRQSAKKGDILEHPLERSVR